MYIISHTFRNSSLDYEQTIRKLNLGVNCGGGVGGGGHNDPMIVRRMTPV